METKIYNIDFTGVGFELRKGTVRKFRKVHYRVP